MVAAVAMVRDEEDIVGVTVDHMTTQVDLVIVADNGSTDSTREILEGLPVQVVDDPDPAYYQSQKMTALAHRAREQGAQWVVPFDADELWLARDAPTIQDALAQLPPHALIADAAVLDHVATASPGLSPWRRAEQLPLRKVAVRARDDLTIQQGNHGATYHSEPWPLVAPGLLEVRHFPYRSASQMIRKARNGAVAYAATDLPEDIGKHWRDYGRLTDAQITEVFHEYFFSGDPQSDGLVRDPWPVSK